MIHQYLKINWQNVISVKNKLKDIQEFSEEIKNNITKKPPQTIDERFKRLVAAIESCSARLVSLQLNCIKQSGDLEAFMEARGSVLFEIAQDTLSKSDDEPHRQECKTIIDHLHAAETGKEIGTNLVSECNELDIPLP